MVIAVVIAVVVPCRNSRIVKCAFLAHQLSYSPGFDLIPIQYHTGREAALLWKNKGTDQAVDCGC